MTELADSSSFGKKRHAADIMVQSCVAFLTLSSLLCTALLAFAGAILGSENTNPGITQIAFVSGLVFLVCIYVTIRTLLLSVVMADEGILDVDDASIKTRMKIVTLTFGLAVLLGVIYLFTVSYFR